MSHGLGVFPSSLPADTARGALPHSVGSGARVFNSVCDLSAKPSCSDQYGQLGV